MFVPSRLWFMFGVDDIAPLHWGKIWHKCLSRKLAPARALLRRKRDLIFFGNVGKAVPFPMNQVFVFFPPTSTYHQYIPLILLLPDSPKTARVASIAGGATAGCGLLSSRLVGWGKLPWKTPATRAIFQWGNMTKHDWLVVWNMNFIFQFLYWMSSFPLTNSYFSRWLLHHQPVIYHQG